MEHENLQVAHCADCKHFGERCVPSANGCGHYEFSGTSENRTDKLIDTYSGIIDKLVLEKADLCREISKLKTELAVLSAKQTNVIHAHWYEDKISCCKLWLCSNCDEVAIGTCMGVPRANFCPNCGAKMDEEVLSDG